MSGLHPDGYPIIEPKILTFPYKTISSMLHIFNLNYLGYANQQWQIVPVQNP